MPFLYPKTYLEQPKLLKDPAETQTWKALPNRYTDALMGAGMERTPAAVPTPAPTLAPTLDNAAKAAQQILTPQAAAAPVQKAPETYAAPFNRTLDELNKGLKRGRTTTEIGTLDPEKIQEAYQEYEKLPEARAAKEGLAQLEAMRQAYAKNLAPAQADISPLFSLLETEFGRPGAGKFYKKGTLAEQQAEQLQKLALETQKQKEENSRRVTDFIKAVKGGSDITSLLQQEAAKTLSERGMKTLKAGESGSIPNVLTKAQTKFNDYEPVKDAIKQQKSAALVRQQISSGRGTDINALYTTVLKMRGEVGNLSESEQNRAIGGVSLRDKLNLWASTKFEGVLDEKTKQEMLEAADIFDRSSKELVGNVRHMMATQLSLAHPEISYDQAYNSLYAGKFDQPLPLPAKKEEPKKDQLPGIEEFLKTLPQEKK